MQFTYEKADELYHHGILGQKWGVRRFQNEDGTLTTAGKRRYGTEERFNEVQKIKTDKRVSNSKFEEEVQKYRESQSAGKRFVKSLIMTPSGAMTYDAARAMNETRGKAFIRSVFDINAGKIAGTGANMGVRAIGNKIGLDPKLTAFNSGIADYLTQYTDLSKASLQRNALKDRYYLKNKH